MGGFEPAVDWPMAWYLSPRAVTRSVVTINPNRVSPIQANPASQAYSKAQYDGQPKQRGKCRDGQQHRTLRFLGDAPQANEAEH